MRVFLITLLFVTNAVWALAVPTLDHQYHPPIISDDLLTNATPATTATTINYILIMNAPDAYTSPTTASATTSLSWQPGTLLTCVDRRAEMCEPEIDLLAGWFLVRRNQTDDPSVWLPGVYLDLARNETATTGTTLIGEEVVDRWNALPVDYAPDDLVSVGPRMDEEIDYKMRREAAKDLKAMIAAAKRNGISLYVTSAYRSWDKQQKNYQAKLEKSGWDQTTVARPGHSEHQLGTAVDLTDGDEKMLLEQSFGDTPAGRWLREHAPEFGFAQSYTEANQKDTGYAPEPWHFRYWGREKAREKHEAALGKRP